MKFILYLLFATFFVFMTQNGYTQVAKNVIVEHFTNTRCSICASSSKNPAFYTNLEGYPDVFHVSYHPSSPYSTCLFSQHNPSENDGRAKYYGVFGGTPRLVVQGVLNPISVQFGSPEVFTPHIDQMTEVSIDIIQTKTADDKIEATITLKTESEHNYSGTSILVGLAEKVVNYQAPNGEDVHYDVFRKALTDVDGDEVTLPAVGESVSFTYSVNKEEEWDMSEMFVYVILNDSQTKTVVQSDAASPSENTVATQDYQTLKNVTVYPNPAQNFLSIELEGGKTASVSLTDVLGSVQSRSKFQGKATINISNLLPGIYLLKIESVDGSYSQKIIIK